MHNIFSFNKNIFYKNQQKQERNEKKKNYILEIRIH